MKVLIKRLEQGYVSEIVEKIEYLKSKGYILVSDDSSERVYHYTVDKGFIDDGTIFDLIPKIREDRVNHYNVQLRDSDIANLTKDTLPLVSMEDLRNLDVCNNIIKHYVEEIEIEKEFEDLVVNQKERSNPDVSKKLYTDPMVQSQVLMNNFVVYCEDSRSWNTTNFYMWSKKDDEFINLGWKNVLELLHNFFEIGNNELSLRDLKRNSDNLVNGLIQTNTPIRWNEYKKFKKGLENHKNDFKLFNRITSNFI